MRRRLGAIWAHRAVLGILVRRDLRVRYASSFLGYLWTIIDPLANALIYYLIFVVIFQRADAGHSPYFLFLLAGLLPWQWFNASVSESTRALISEQKLVKSTKLPRELWIIRLVTAKGIEFVLSLPVLALFFVIYWATGHARLDWEIVYFPIAMALQFLLLVGVGLVLAPLTVIVSDIQPLVRIFLRIYFYLCPIIFQLQFLDKPQIPEFVRLIYEYNPFAGVLELYRAGFFANDVNWGSVTAGLVGTAIMLALGGWVFARMEKSVLKEI